MKSNAPCIIKWIFIWQMLLQHPEIVKGQKYNLTKSDSFATLGKPFTFACSMFIPPGQAINGVSFKRNSILIGSIGWVSSPPSASPTCKAAGANPRYIWNCAAVHNFTVTIPAENMTEYEQHSIWRCEYIGDGMAKSPDVSLDISIDVYNVSLIPSEDKLDLTEGRTVMLSCTVNSNALPPPTITWYLGSTDITSMAAPNTSTISITGNRTDNAKVLRCNATNNSKPPKTVTTILDIKYPPTVFRLSQQNPYERSNLAVECGVEHGNPTATKFFWSKVNDPGFKQNKSILELLDIRRNSTGTYKCTAENMYSNDEKGTDYQTMFINVLYPPSVIPLTKQILIEGHNLLVICMAKPGNPNTTSFLWRKSDTGIIRREATLDIRNIQRNSSGIYQCTAQNSYNNTKKGTDSQDMVVEVLFPPSVSFLSQQNVNEGDDLLVECLFTPGNPNSTTVFWTKIDEHELRYNGNEKTLFLRNILRNSSGTYRCTAENAYNSTMVGNHSQDMVVNVLYKPTIVPEPPTIINENELIVLTREIDSNPPSNITWLNGTDVLAVQTSVNRTTLVLSKATCLDTNNFTLVASNTVLKDVKTFVELIVNCQPMAIKNNITLGVGDNSGISFSTTIIAYPQPTFLLKYENGTTNDQMTGIITRSNRNKFAVSYNQTVVHQHDYGTYHLQVTNEFGNTTIFVNVIPQRKPDMPRNSEVTCEIKSAKVQWLSSFNGGDFQKFVVIASIGKEEAIRSEYVVDEGENRVHEIFVQNLQPSTMYNFHVFAENKHGNISSDIRTCMTKDVQGSLPIIAGSAAAGGFTFAVIIIVTVVFLRRFKKREKQVGKSQRLNNDECTSEDTDDGLKENILYVSAGPRSNNESERAVYAAVTKKPLEDNANVYADVKKDGKKIETEAAIYSDVKPKKGLLKKDGKQKQKNGKKQRGKQAAADVYENSEDIAMTSNADNVYSNTNYNAKNDKEQRGYKNKDGLLYVDVQFDAKKGNENPVIHGEDEKTDYATVEFPMPSSSQEDAKAEK